MIGVTIRGAELVEHPHELLDTGAVLVGDGPGGFEEYFGCPLPGEFEVKVTGGGEGEFSGSTYVCGGGSWGQGGSGGGRRVGLIGIVVLRRRRGEVFFIHEKVEAFFVFLLVVMVLSGGSRAT